MLALRMPDMHPHWMCTECVAVIASRYTEALAAYGLQIVAPSLAEHSNNHTTTAALTSKLHASAGQSDSTSQAS